MDYKKTLNLPHTQFSMKANLKSLEPEILSHWQRLGIYHRLRQERKGKDKFILHDGPPYANGRIHMGHVLNKVLKDVVIKYKVMRGYDCPFVVGWDCHGLPVEHQLLKELNLTKHDVEVGEFRKKAHEFALKFVELQREDFIRLGVFGDWRSPYLTLDPQYEYAVIKLLEFLVRQGYVYRARLPVNWCATCETALAEAEVEYEMRSSPSIYVTFKVKEFGSDQLRMWVEKKLFASNPDSRPIADISFVIWTTTPWTLISNVAVALSPHEDYVALWGPDGKVWIIAQKLKSRFLKTLGRNESQYLERFPSFGRTGKIFEGSIYEHPFGFREGKCKIVCAEYVSMEEGTGCVHIAPGHGQEDYLTGREYNLEVVMPVDKKGKFDSSVAQFAGMHVHEADKKIIEALQKQNNLLSVGEVTHSYPHCWRCKNPIIFRATFQWFLNVDHKNLRERLVAETESVEWVPSSGKERMRGMLTLRPDWCLSRQRLWGVPIPALRCKNCQEVILNEKVVKKTASLFKEKGSDCWFHLDVEEFIPSGLKCPGCGKRHFIKEYDILDVWFESGASFAAVLKPHPQLELPADMYLEGSDQHRGWFQASLIPSVAEVGSSPFKTILTHGFVVDGEGRKMSKSLGNVIAPQPIIDQYGSEILRFWTASSNYSEDIKISPEIIRQLVDVYRKIRNTIRFLLGNLADYSPQRDSLPYEELLEVDRAMLSKAMATFGEVISFYESWSFYKACQKIFHFCNIDLSSFYLDILKDRLYTFSPKSTARRSAQFVLCHILKMLLKMIAPILSFTAEEAYRSCQSLEGKKDSIFISQFDEDYVPEWIDRDLNERWAKIFSLRDRILKEIEIQREKGIVGSSLEARVCVLLDGDDYTFYKGHQETLREILIVSQVDIGQGSFHIKVDKSDGKKCLRCWNWRNDVDSDREFSGICGRCVEALKGGKR
ncbi:MAG: isoleucine--tRNA ligase [Candidatus Omnitrophota bacterium]|nr:MAG: isoleucine--tRNA ligase [Candidatus Omnitrophota bacterium]